MPASAQLLTRKQEAELARELREATDQTRRAVLVSPVAPGYLARLLRDVEERRIRLVSVFGGANQGASTRRLVQLGLRHLEAAVTRDEPQLLADEPVLAPIFAEDMAEALLRYAAPVRTAQLTLQGQRPRTRTLLARLESGRCTPFEASRRLGLEPEALVEMADRSREARAALARFRRQSELTPEQLHTLAERVRDGLRRRKGVQQTMVQANMGMVVKLAQRFTGRGLDFDELQREGSLGLLRAIDKFDERFGYTFSTYAIWWIRQTMTRAIAQDARANRVPPHADAAATEPDATEDRARISRERVRQLERAALDRLRDTEGREAHRAPSRSV